MSSRESRRAAGEPVDNAESGYRNVEPGPSQPEAAGAAAPAEAPSDAPAPAATPTPDPTEPHFTRSSPDSELAAPLVADLARDYDARYGLNDGIPSSVELSRYPADLFDESQGGVFLILEAAGRALAGGAFLRVDETTAEMKRVWTHPDHRRRGYGRRVMAELERLAAERAYTRVILTTGARQPEAVALYLELGYHPLFDLHGDLEEISYLRFEKHLVNQGDVM